MRIRKIFLVLLCVLLVAPAWGKVFLRWTQPAIPPALKLGVSEIVVLWAADPLSLLEAAHKQGYRVYAEVNLQQASAAAKASSKKGLAGIILNAGDSERRQVDELLRSLRSAYPQLRFMVLNSNGKQPEMRGQVVIKKDGVLEATSPTAQPWVDSNLALVRIEQAFRPEAVPLYGFQWNLADPLQQQQGPDTADYSLAVAEAGAFHSDLILDLHQNLQKGLTQDDVGAWGVWNEVKRYLQFYTHSSEQPWVPEANVGVVTDDDTTFYEPINLLARHNIQVRVMRSAEVKMRDIAGLAGVVLFTAPTQAAQTVADFAARGGVVIVVNMHGSYPWQSAKSVREGEHSVAYSVGKGRVIELAKPVTDPETFAQDVRRLIDKQKILISLWNALTTVAVRYRQRGDGTALLELVNYAAEPLQVQVQVQGSFRSLRYETPERGCCQYLTAVERGGFTEFVVPWLRVGGRVHLERKGGMGLPMKAPR